MVLVTVTLQFASKTKQMKKSDNRTIKSDNQVSSFLSEAIIHINNKIPEWKVVNFEDRVGTSRQQWSRWFFHHLENTKIIKVTTTWPNQILGSAIFIIASLYIPNEYLKETEWIALTKLEFDVANGPWYLLWSRKVKWRQIHEKKWSSDDQIE